MKHLLSCEFNLDTACVELCFSDGSMVFTMKHLLSCEFNLDTACVELCFSDGSMVSIDTIAVENEVVNNMYQQSELDYLIYNDPAAYADLILNGDPAVYLKTVTEYQNLD